jgi:hypothetical protein
VANEDLPPLYRRWAEGFLPAPIERERLATCDRCIMLDPSSLAPEELYNPKTKCCTYTPDLPNYLAGRILADTDPAMQPARRFLEMRVAGGAGVTPISVAPTPVYVHLYDHRAPAAFGRTPILRCAFYVNDGGRCGIHQHRDGVCSTWFCKHNRAGSGRAFWTAIRNVFKVIERTLVWWAVDQSDLDAAARLAIVGMDQQVKQLDQFQISGVASPALRQHLWGNFAGREAEFFRGCAERVEALSWPEVLAIGGGVLAYQIRIAREAQARLADPRLPERVTRGTGVIQLGPRPGTVRLRVFGASPAEAGVMPTRAVELAAQLTNGPLAPTLARLRAAGHDIDDDAVRTLLDYQVLVPRA